MLTIFNQLAKKATIILVIICLIFSQFLIDVKIAYSEVINKNNIAIADAKLTDWYDVDKRLVENMKKSLKSAEDFASEELDNYIDKLMVNVDERFLNWYFNFWYQKAIEYGGALSWIVFKLDEPLKVFRKEDEKNLNSSEVIQKRLTEDFYNKFQELVFTKSSQKEFIKIIERTGNLYGHSVEIGVAEVKNLYKIPDEDWDGHLGELANLIYNTGNSKSGLSADNFGSALLTQTTVVGATVIGAKLFSNVALKAGSKLAVKGGASVAISATQLIDPILAIGFIAWDVWDYNNMVTNSRPILRQNILDYLTEFKYQTLQNPEIGIVPNLEEIQNSLITKINLASL